MLQGGLVIQEMALRQLALMDTILGVAAAGIVCTAMAVLVVLVGLVMEARALLEQMLLGMGAVVAAEVLGQQLETAVMAPVVIS